jgi:hypothetical protein
VDPARALAAGVAFVVVVVLGEPEDPEPEPQAARATTAARPTTIGRVRRGFTHP